MRREYSATLDGREVEISVEARDGGLWRVSVEGREHLIDAARVRPGTWSLLIDGRSHLVDLDDRRGGTAVIAGNTETRILLEDARRKRLARAVGAGGGAGAGEVLKAPIAGKVVKVLVEVGDVAEPGQSLAVLEAMKMENEIKADRGGKVEAVRVAAGDSVETGESLIELAPAEE